MKELNKKNIKEFKKNETTNDILIFIQIVLLFILLILGVCTIFIKELGLVTELILGLLLIVIGINNNRRYKRKFFTIIYFVVGILIIGLTVYAIINNAI